MSDGKKTKEELQAIVKFAVTEAIDFIESEISEERNKAQRYFDGEVDMGHEEGRSSVVATKIRDTVRTIVPNLMRVFLSTDKPVEFLAMQPKDVMSMEQATKYITSEFERMDGFRILSDVMQDVCVKKNGFVKAWWEETDYVTHHRFTNLTDEEVQLLLSEEGVEAVDQEVDSEQPPEPDPVDGQMIPGMDPLEQAGNPGMPNPMAMMNPMAQGVQQSQAPATHKLTLKRTVTKGRLNTQLIPPEDFFIDSSATCLDDAYCYGHQSEMRVTDVVAMGFDYNEVKLLGSLHAETDESTEKYERADYTEDNDNVSHADDSMKLITLTEAFMRIDTTGDGVAELHKVILAGKEYKMLEIEPFDNHCIAVFESDPIAHLFFGNAIPDILFNEQDAATSMLRGVLDNIQLVNQPRTEVNDDIVNMDDMMNNEIGGIVRSKAPGQGIVPLTVPFVAGETMPAIMYFDQQVDAKTGINSMTAGLNGDELQNQTATATNALKQAGATQLESIARHVGRGLSDLYKIMLRLTVENSDEEVMMRMHGNEFVKLDPRSWNVEMDTIVNVGLGTGREGEKHSALSSAVQLQIQMAQMGAKNLPDPMRNAVQDILAIAGIRNIERYFPKADPAEQGQGQDKGGDPAQALIEAEKVKAESSEKEKMADIQIKLAEMKGKDDLERDRMAQDLQIEFAKILGQYGTTVDVAAIKGEQEMQRQAMTPQPQPQGQPQGQPQPTRQ